MGRRSTGRGTRVSAGRHRRAHTSTSTAPRCSSQHRLQARAGRQTTGPEQRRQDTCEGGETARRLRAVMPNPTITPLASRLSTPTPGPPRRHAAEPDPATAEPVSGDVRRGPGGLTDPTTAHLRREASGGQGPHGPRLRAPGTRQPHSDKRGYPASTRGSRHQTTPLRQARLPGLDSGLLTPDHGGDQRHAADATRAAEARCAATLPRPRPGWSPSPRGRRRRRGG